METTERTVPEESPRRKYVGPLIFVYFGSLLTALVLSLMGVFWLAASVLAVSVVASALRLWTGNYKSRSDRVLDFVDDVSLLLLVTEMAIRVPLLALAGSLIIGWRLRNRTSWFLTPRRFPTSWSSSWNRVSIPLSRWVGWLGAHVLRHPATAEF